MIEIKQLTEASEATLKDINVLVQQLSERLPECSIELLQKIVTSKNLELWVAQDQGRVVGMGTLAVVSLPEGERAQVEDVVVHESNRGQGLGEKISSKLIERAKARNIRVVTLSSRADRVAANKLYQKLGFEEWKTNVYRLKL